MRNAQSLVLVVCCHAVSGAHWPPTFEPTATPSWPDTALARIVVVPDVHGDFDHLVQALALGRVLGHGVGTGALALGPGDVVIFLGDLADRGPKSLEVYDLVDEIATFAGHVGACMPFIVSVESKFCVACLVPTV